MNKINALLKLAAMLTLAIVVSCSSGDKDTSIFSQIFKGNSMLTESVSRIYISEESEGDISPRVKDAFDTSLMMKININSRLAVVDSPDKSDLVLKISLSDYSSVPVRFNSVGIAEEIKLHLDSFVWLVSASTGEELIRKKKVESELFYSDINPPVMSEYKAITVLTDQLAERIISVATTGWYLDKQSR